MKISLNHYSDLPVLETDRLLLKPLNKSYLSQNYVDWMNDGEVNRYLESGGDYNLKKLNEYLTEVERNPKYFWAIILKEINKHIGNIKIDPINLKHYNAEYGIMMGDKNEWGKGYAKEVSKLVIDYCFKTLKLRKITLGVIEKNERAINLYLSLKFKVEGKLIDQVKHNGIYCNVLRMAIFNDKFKL